MAEAHQAAHEPQVSYKDEGTADKGLKTKVAKSFFLDFSECAFRTKKQIIYGRWPTTWDNLIVSILIVFLIMAVDHPLSNYISNHLWYLGDCMHLDDSFPIIFRILVISLISSFLYFICAMYVRQYVVRILLSYKGWLYQPPRSQSIIVMLWAVLIKIFSHRKPRIYSYQGSLPRMPVPPLKTTIKKLLDSLKPILDKEEFTKMEDDAKKFLCTIGPKLQWVLYLKSWWSPNYYTDWWEKYVYLMSRDPIAINSNYYIADQIKWIPTKKQTSRAAGVTSLILQFKSLLESEKLEPLLIRDTIPLCMLQYQRMFGTARIPGTDGDTVVHHPESEHIVVYAKGHFYKVNIEDSHGKALNLLDYESLFDWILKDAETWSSTTEAELHVASLTSNDRTTWANCRQEHFTSGVNSHSIHAIEEAIFVVILDDYEFPETDDRVKYLLHGSGSSIWFDKSICALFMKDGRVGVNVEHSWADAPVIGHLVEYFTTHEYLYRMYDDEGYCKSYLSPFTKKALAPSKAIITPMRLYWDVNSALEKSINESYLFALKNNEDLQMSLRIHDAFGKGLMKKARIGPDAFYQMALQLAYYKDSNGLFANTYEASMTRLYLEGRTETVRSFTQEVKEFVLSMNDPSSTAAERMRLMRVSAERHQKISKDCMNGKGVDRHLFALYVVCKGQGYDSPFLKNSLTMPWTLSTSQGPLFQMKHGLDINNERIRNCMSPGGGFGPVSHNGYGIGYILMSDFATSFHISSKKSCPTTNAYRYMDNLFWALNEMKLIVEETSMK